MKRLLYIPNESLPKLTKFLTLDKKAIGTFINILKDSENKTIVDLYLSIMNEMNVSDDDAAAIFSTYKYLLSVLEENNLSFSDLIPETKYILETSKIQDYNKIINNIAANSEYFANLFSTGSIEKKFAKKNSYLPKYSIQLSISILFAIYDLFLMRKEMKFWTF